MTLFLIVFILLYSSMHLYAFVRARAAFALHGAASVLVVFIMILMTFAPVIVRLSERAGFENFAKVTSYAGYIWMGALFLFVSASAVVDIYRFTVYSAALILKKDLASLVLSPKTVFAIPLLTAIVISIYGYFEAKNIITEKITVRTPKVSGRFRIAQISDVHLGLIVREQRLRMIVDRVKSANPDMLVSTGDLVDGQTDNLNGLSAMLNEIKPAYGKFAVTGNHEFYAGLPQSLKFTEASGFRILRGESVVLDNNIAVAGVDDLQIIRASGSENALHESRLLKGLNDKGFVVLLKHRPFVDKDSSAYFDLQLSGHVHKGQIFPFSILTRLYYPIHAGYKKLAEGSSLYVSRGSGTWGPPIRFLSPPEITVIDIAQADN